MPRLHSDLILPTDDEDAAITAAALSDPDALPLTDDEWERIKPRLHRGRLLVASGHVPLAEAEAAYDRQLDESALTAPD